MRFQILAKSCVLVALLTLSRPVGAQEYQSACPAKFLRETVALTNYVRQSHGLSQLNISEGLMESSNIRAGEMVKSGSLTHDGWKQSILSVGYKNLAIGENIAKNFFSAQAVTQAWYKSKGHRDNLLDPNYKRIGIGCAYDKSGSIWWSQHFSE